MPTDYHAASPGEAVGLLSSDSDAGLSDAEAARRQEQLGPNRLTRQKRPDYLALATRQIANPLVLLLFGAAGVSIWLGEYLEAAVIGTILVLNAALGFREEALAEREIIALREGVELRANVIRAGRRLTVPASEITVGDLVVLEEGDRVVADARLVAGTGMEIDESLLTGESLPVGKSLEQVSVATPLAERTSMTYAATAVTRGRGAALVTAIGSATEVGQIAHLVGTAKPPATPMQRRLGDLTARMVVLGLAVTGLLAGAMILRDSSA
ncbi:MAG: cation-transporting P-type ATPase, partial [Gaiellaceae bacterium]